MIQKFTKLSVIASILTVCCGLFASTAFAQTYSNPAAITINAVGAATPSPSVINVTGGPAAISIVSVTLNGMSHTWQDDIDVMLLAPNGETLVLMSDVGLPTGSAFTNQTFVFGDFGAANMTAAATQLGGTYKPSNIGAGDVFTGYVGPINNPAPAGVATFASVFGGDAANGNWSLFIQDDVAGDAGSVSGGWSITFSAPLTGCTDATACNFNPSANANDGSCVFPGCTNSGAINYDPTAGCDDGSCCFSNIVTFNMFDSFGDGWNGAVATIVDASGNTVATGTIGAGLDFNSIEFCADQGCYFITVTAGGFPAEVSWEVVTAEGTVLDGGAPANNEVFGVGGEVCIAGCLDPLATNYDPNATIDNASCIYCAPGEQVAVINMFDTFGDGWNGALYFLTDDAGNIVAQGGLNTAEVGDGLSEGSDALCLPAGCYTLTVTPGSFPLEIDWSITTGDGTIIASGADPDGSGQAFAWAGATGCTIPGCTDPGCNNYNPQASEDDGSCECPPANDGCAAAVAIGCGVTVSGTTTFSNTDGVPNCLGIAQTSGGVWYTFIGTGDQISLSTCASAVDTKLQVFAGTCNALVCVAANDDDPNCAGFASSVLFTSQPAVQYYVLVSEFGVGVGVDFDLTMECIACGGAPFNDACAQALPLPDGAQVGGSLCCTNPDDIAAVNPFASGYGVWYSMNSADFDSFDFNLTNVSGTNAGLIVYSSPTASCGDLDVVAVCGPVTGTCAGSLYEANIAVTQNTQYYFLVYTNAPADCGDYTFTADLIYVGCTDPFASNYNPDATVEDGSCAYDGPPANDLCASAFTLNCNEVIAGTTALSTATGAPTACGVSNGDNGVWYTFVGDGQFHTISTCGSAIDTRIEVLSAAACGGPYTCVVSADDDATDAGCGFFSGDDAVVEFISTVGTNYYVYITAGAADTNGDFQDDLFDGAFSIDFQCSPVVQGCTDPCACNYNDVANVDDASCEFFSCVTCTNGIAVIMNMNDEFGDGWNDATYAIEDLAGNIVATGSIDDAQCSVDANNFVGPETGFDVFCLEDGCYNITVGGGDWDAEISWSLEDANGNVIIAGEAETLGFTVGAGVCGCTDAGACNFDPAATDDDGSCEFDSCAGCTDNTACNFDPNATISNPVECCYDNCITLIMNDSFGDGWNGNTAVITDESTGAIVGTGTVPAGGSTATATFCLPDGCYRITVGGGTFPGEVSYILTGTNNGIITGGVSAAGVQFSTGSGNCTPGCMEPLACNYDANAGFSDCTLCEYDSCQGCTYSQAENFDPAALIDDGSCIINAVDDTCPEDLNNDGIIGVADLIQLLGAFGSNC